MSPRYEPLLWLQLVGVAMLPLEALLVLLVLAGNDPGPFPVLERLFCWALGAVAPAVLLWQRPADLWSLLLVQTPLRARSELQLRLSALQSAPVLRVALMLGTAGLLPLLWWLDSLAPMASRFSPLLGAPRLSSLLLSAALLALMLWQWLQLWQALWVLSRPPETISQATPLSQADLEGSRLCLGLPLLLLEPLAMEVPAGDGSPATTAPVVPDSAAAPDSAAVAIEPEQAAEQSEGSQLDQQVD